MPSGVSGINELKVLDKLEVRSSRSSYFSVQRKLSGNVKACRSLLQAFAAGTVVYYDVIFRRKTLQIDFPCKIFHIHVNIWFLSR